MFGTITYEIIQALTALILITGGYAAYYFIAFSGAAQKKLITQLTPANKIVFLFLFQKITGFIFLGLVPAVIFFNFFSLHPQRYAIGGLPAKVPAFVVLVVISLIVITAGFSAKKEDIYNRIPHMRLSRWGFKDILTSIGGWALYLLAYEFIFRGLLLFSTAAAFGVWSAIGINLLLYSFFHIPNGKKEVLASIPFGLLLCIFSLLTGSFWLAFLFHLVLSSSTEVFSIYFNPDMQFQLKRKH
jgi:membrane protease YdiL (CAAX protease family)